MLEFSKWLNENIGEDPIRPNPRPTTGPKPTPGPMRPTKTPVVAKPDDSDSAGSGIDLETKPLDKNRLQSSVNDFLKKLDEKITRMIGKTLNAYKNKNSDAFRRAAITLRAYHDELIKRYNDWTTKLISRMDKAPSPPPMNFNEADQRYSLGQYAQEMYKVAKKTWEEWLESGLVSGDADAILWLANKSGYKDIALKTPQYKKVDRLPDGSLDLSQFIKIILKSPYARVYKSNAKLIEKIHQISDLDPDEYESVLAEVLEKFKIGFEEYVEKINRAELTLQKTRKDIKDVRADAKGVESKLMIAAGVGSIPFTLGLGAMLLSAVGFVQPEYLRLVLGLGVSGFALGGTGLFGGILGSDQKRKEADAEIQTLSRKEDRAMQQKEIAENELKKASAKEFLEDMIHFINGIGKDVADKYMGSVK